MNKTLAHQFKNAVLQRKAVQCAQRIMEWLRLEGTSGDALVQPLSNQGQGQQGCSGPRSVSI